jgi:thiol-disulfide isomerase/thioredoxin
MNEVRGEAPGKARFVWAALGMMPMLALVYGAYAMVAKPGDAGLSPLAKGAMAKLQVARTLKAPPAAPLEGPDGRPMKLADLKGEVLVVNLWASWCAPCAKEMPTLAKLQAAYKGKPVRVVTISLDKDAAGIAKAKARIAQNAPLRFYHAPYALAFAFEPAVQGLPTTVIYDRSGRERARLVADADWSRPEARAVIDRLLALKE